MHRIPVGVLGASGYAGRELCALVTRHPRLTLAFATANGQRGERAELPRGGSVTFVATEDAPLGKAALVFSALPHGASKAWVERARAAGAKVVDLSSDFRIGNGANGANGANGSGDGRPNDAPFEPPRLGSGGAGGTGASHAHLK
ncbi:MAG TPA: hypothetical protein VIH11_02215 [Gemmatimonadaceae bacterium]